MVVASGHRIFAAGVRAALEEDGIAVCAEAADARHTVAEVARNRPDICLLDLALPGGAITAVRAIAVRVPETLIVGLTDSSSDEQLFAVLQAGADGYLVKDIGERGLAAALRGVIAGEAALPRTLVSRLIDELRRRQRARTVPLPGRASATLTEREWDVVEHLLAGASTARTAEMLGIAPVTVRRHVSEITRKLQAPTRAAALRLLRSVERSGDYDAERSTA